MYVVYTSCMCLELHRTNCLCREPAYRVMSRTRLNELCGRQMMARWKPRRVSFPTRGGSIFSDENCARRRLYEEGYSVYSTVPVLARESEWELEKGIGRTIRIESRSLVTTLVRDAESREQVGAEQRCEVVGLILGPRGSQLHLGPKGRSWWPKGARLAPAPNTPVPARRRIMEDDSVIIPSCACYKCSLPT